MTFYVLMLDADDEFDAISLEEQELAPELIAELLATCTLASSPPTHDGLLLWVDASESSRERGANARACILFSRLYGTRDPLVYGPLIVTGGTAEHPEALSLDQIHQAKHDLFGMERDHGEAGRGGNS